MHRIATVINYCSNESPFLQPCIEQARLFSKQICVPVADHFFNGTPENMQKLQDAYATFADCTFLQFAFDSEKIPQKYKEIERPRVWHNIARCLAYAYLDADIDYVLFLDADEIIDASRFQRWLDTNLYQEYKAMKLCNYWYFRDVCYQAATFEDSLLLVKKSALSKALLMHKDERDGVFDHIQGAKNRRVLGPDDKPMGHHYSWVRSQEEMLKKTESWGHSQDRDWKSCIEEEFSKEFQGKDFVHGYTFKKVEPFVQLDRKDRSTYKTGTPKYTLSADEWAQILGSSKFSLTSFLQSFWISS